MKSININMIKLLSLGGILCMLTACNVTKSESEEAIAQVDVATSRQAIDVYGDVKILTHQEMIIDFPAIVEHVYVQDGDEVKKGDTLLTLNLEDYHLQIKTKENEIHMDEIQLKELEAQSNPQRLEAARIKEELGVKEGYEATGEDPDLKPLENSLEIIEQSIELAKNQYETSKALLEVGLIASDELKEIEQILRGKEKEKKDTLNAIEKIKTNRSLEISALDASLKSTQMQFTNSDIEKNANIQKLKLKITTSKMVLSSMKDKLNKPYLKDNALIAPEDHLIIYDINCLKGTQIDHTSGAILKAMYKDTLYVTADIPEESLSFVNVGDGATITLAGQTPNTITGKISKLSNRAIEKDGDTIVEALIAIDKGKEFLKPGLTADITITSF